MGEKAPGLTAWRESMTVQNTTPETVGNLPFSATQAFTADDIALILGTCMPDAVFILDEEDRWIVAGNMQFLSLAGIDLEVLESGEFAFDQLIETADRALFDAHHRAIVDSPQGEGEGAFEIHIVKADASVVPVRMRLKNLRWKRRRYTIGFVADITRRDERVTLLKTQVEQQKQRAFEAIKSSLRLYQFNEKIKRTPHFAKSLLHICSEEKLFAEAAKLLVNEDGLGYKDATFLLAEASALRVVFSTMAGVSGSVYPLSGDHRFSRFVRNGFTQDDDAGAALLVPLQSRGQFIGIFEVTSHTKEKVFFGESNMVVEWQKGVLHDIGGILALLIDNLRLNREIKRRAVTDSLTQTYNRHYFVTRLAAEVRRVRRYSRPTSLIFSDIDKFKEINDQYGHLQGDEVLKDLGKLFLANTREVDVVCRYGGDEFVMLLPETDLPMARQTAEKICEAVRTFPFRLLDNPAINVPVTLSVGVSLLDTQQDEDDFLRMADEALYEAKKTGRDRVVVSSATKATGE